MRVPLLPLLVAFAPAGLAHDAPAPVTIKAFAFGPRALEIPAATTVVWTNGDDIEHTVTSGAPDRPDGAFDYSLANKGATASMRFETAGTRSYFCRRHSFMRGEIRVLPKGDQ